jgi:hypothetical protein
MRSKLANFLLHTLGLALVCVIAAYWVIRIATPAPAAAPPPLASAPLRQVDPVLAARLFGLVQTAAPAASNVQVSGVYVAGARSAAVLVVDGKLPRTYVQGAEIAAGVTLLEVRPDRVVIETNGVRQEVGAPVRPASASPSAPQPPGFTRAGNVLSAPPVTAAPGSPRGPTAAPAFIPPPPPPAPPPPPDLTPFTPPVPVQPQAQVVPVQPGIVTEAPAEAQSEEEQEPQRVRRGRRSPLVGAPTN